MPQGHYGFPNILQLVRTTSLKVLGKPGATAGAGLAGGTTSGAPTTGQFDAGDAVVAQNGHLWICTVSGTPGTWVDAGASGSYTDPLTTRGDLLVRGAASTGRLPLGPSGYIVTSDGTDAVWAAAGAGFADPMTTRGDLIVRGGSGTTRLALGSSGQQIKSDGTDAVWATPALTQIASTVLGSTTASITFSSIAGTYSALQVVLAARGDTAAANTGLCLQFNGDTAANYDYSYMWGFQNASASANVANATANPQISLLCANTAPANQASGAVLWIPVYAGTTFLKTWVCSGTMQDSNTARTFTTQQSGTWRSTAAITSIKIYPAAGSFVTGTTAVLYGWL